VGTEGNIWPSENGSNSRLEKNCKRNIIRQNKLMCMRWAGNIALVNVRNAYYLTGKEKKRKKENRKLQAYVGGSYQN
jgi:hypothetical protein